LTSCAIFATKLYAVLVRGSGKVLTRKMEKQLFAWKSNPDRMPLIVKGARQVGKTFTITKFCEENYRYHYHIDFMQMPRTLAALVVR